MKAGPFASARKTDKTDDGYVRMQLLAAFLDTSVASLAALCLGDKNSEAEQRLHARIGGGWHGRH